MVTRRLAGFAALSLSLSLAACGASKEDAAAGAGGGAAAGGSGATGGSGGSGGVAPAGQIERIVGGDWSIEPGDERYYCARHTLDHDVYVHEFRPVTPLGTHHTVISVEPGTHADGIVECADPFEGSSHQIFGTGKGTDSIAFPEGVAVKLSRGEQIMANLHLFNVGAEVLTGTSAIDVVAMDPADVVHEAQMQIDSQFLLEVVPGKSTQTGNCTAPAPVTVFSVIPHMHQTGVHFKATHAPISGAPRDFVDTDFDFDAQLHQDLTPTVDLAAGDQLNITCTYDNPTNKTLTFGESSTDEMCILGIFYYPALMPACL